MSIVQAIKESTGVDLASLVSSNQSSTIGGSFGTEGTGNREAIRMNGEETTDLSLLQSDRPRLMAREQELQHQMRKLGSKRFLFSQGPERMQINTELMKLRSQLSEVSKQLNRPVVWYK